MKNIEVRQQYDVLESPKLVKDLVIAMPEYAGMLAVIGESLPEIKKTTENFHKTQSQFMDNMLTVSHPTPLRNARQILSEINQTEQAIKSAYINIYKKEVEIEIKKRDLENESDELKQKLIQLDILELHTNLDAAKSIVGGAIRRMTNHTAKFNELLDAHNIRNFTEEDFEKEEEKYHIMKAFDQGLTAARSRGGLIDEGNMIYFTQIGINGASAQRQVSLYLQEEGRMIHQGEEPSHGMYLKFLENMAEKYKNKSKEFAEYKGMNGNMSQVALLTGPKSDDNA